MAKLILRTLELTFYHLLIYFVDRLSRLPRASVPRDAMRLYRENLALKVQLDAVAAETRLAQIRLLSHWIGRALGLERGPHYPAAHA